MFVFIYKWLKNAVLCRHRLVSDPILLDIAAQYVGPDIALFQTHWIAKPPLDGMPVLYHQDGER